MEKQAAIVSILTEKVMSEKLSNERLIQGNYMLVTQARSHACSNDTYTDCLIALVIWKVPID
jgi:hypothetical protein